MAEGILRDKLKKNNIPASVDSCGFESFHIGDPPDSRAQVVAGKRGIDLSAHRVRLFTRNDFDEFDHIYIMDSSHYRGLMNKARNDTDMKKVDYVMNVLYPAQNLDVRDPWYYDTGAFEKVFVQLDQACEVIAKNLKNGSNPR